MKTPTKRAAKKGKTSAGEDGMRRLAELARPPETPASPTPHVPTLSVAPPARLLDHLQAPAPDEVCERVGLPSGASYGMCLKQRLLLSAIVDGEIAAAKELLERLELAVPETHAPFEFIMRREHRPQTVVEPRASFAEATEQMLRVLHFTEAADLWRKLPKKERDELINFIATLLAETLEQPPSTDRIQ